MTKRIIQDVVFPSQRAKQARLVPHIAKEEPRTPAPGTHGAEGEGAPRTYSSASQKTAQPSEDFLPKLSKKSNRELQSPEWTKNTEGDRGTKRPRIVMWSLAGIAVIAMLVVLFPLFFSGAVVNVVPRSERVSLKTDYMAKENADLPSIIPYKKIILLPEQRSKTVPLAFEKTVAQKASGTITIFNEYSAASQRLIKNTRFESASGKIYRIENSVVIPGMKIVEGKSVAGSIDAVAYGDAPGEEYNSDRTDFSIPGFKGDPRYKKFYARSQTPITGGFSGTIKVPSPEDIAAAQAHLRDVLRGELIEKARLQVAQLPEPSVLYDGATFIVFNDIEARDASVADPSRITVEGTLYGIMFENSVLSKFIAQKTIAGYDNSPVSVRNIADLTLAPKSEITDPASIKDFPFTLSGEAAIVWDVDYEALKQNLAGASKGEGFKSIVENVPSIKNAQALLQPFWKRQFPKDPKDITIQESLE